MKKAQATPMAALLVAIDTTILVQATGQTGRAVRMWKAGLTLPRPALLPKIAQAADIALGELREAYTADYFLRKDARKRRRKAAAIA